MSRPDWMPDPEVFIETAIKLDASEVYGLGELPRKEFRYMQMRFSGDSGVFEFNHLLCSWPSIQKCRVLALCFAAAMAETGDL